MPNRARKTYSRRRNLTAESFHGLLAFLDPDPSRAAEKYEKVREKLTRFFEWKGCIPGEDYTDETFDRVARRLEAGLEATPPNPYVFFHGFALNVIRERWRKAENDPRPLTAISDISSATSFSTEHDQLEKEKRLGCLHDCIDRLT